MARQYPPIQFEDIPLDQAIRMSLPAEVRFVTMKNRILRVAAKVQVPVTVRRVPGGLALWRSTDEDIQQAREITERLQGARRRRRARPDKRRHSRS